MSLSSSCFKTVPSTPFMNLLELSAPKLFANSTASFITTFFGTFWLK